MERMRFVTSGTEAMMSAVRVARAFTGRVAILKFAGNYHGHFDLALLDAGASAARRPQRNPGRGRGATSRSRATTISRRWTSSRSHDSRATSPRSSSSRSAANMGFVPPAAGFLEGLRERARRWGALLIFDEVITWLRFGLQGAQGRTAIMPDLTGSARSWAAGAPIAAFGGRKDVMAVLAPDGETFTGGTHGGNPFCVAMAHRVLDLLEAHPGVLRGNGRPCEAARRWDSLDPRAARALPYAVVQPNRSSISSFAPAAPNRNYDDARARRQAGVRRVLSRHARARHPAAALAERGDVRLDRAHGERDVDETLDAIAASLDAVYPLLPGTSHDSKAKS